MFTAKSIHRICMHGTPISMMMRHPNLSAMTPYIHHSLLSSTVESSHTSMVKMPSIMDSVEGTVLDWMKHEGESVHEGESICRVEVGDMLLELEAPFDGIVADILVETNNPIPADSDVVVVCDSRDSYMNYFETARIAAHEAEMIRILEESKAEKEIRPSAGIVLREVRHLVQEGLLDPVGDADFVKALQTLARKGHPELLAVFDASFEGLYFNTDTFNIEFFLEQARAVVEESMQQ